MSEDPDPKAPAPFVPDEDDAPRDPETGEIDIDEPDVGDPDTEPEVGEPPVEES